MKIATRNSVYKLEQKGGKVVATKMRELVEGRQPEIRAGDVFEADSVSPIVIGESFYIADLTTSPVTAVENEPGDEAICFKPIRAVVELNEEQFREALQAKLGGEYERALDLFGKCGRHLSFDVTNVLLHAADQGKVDEVLSAIQKHYVKHLQYQHPDIRGCVANWAGVNPTEVVFREICEKTLGLEPHAA